MYDPHIDKMLRASYDPKKNVIDLMKVSGRIIRINDVVEFYIEGTTLSVSYMSKGVVKSITIGDEKSLLDVLPGYWVKSIKVGVYE